MSGPCWHILTGEYPSRPGGVSDYSALLASALAAAGAEVHVWTTPAGSTPAAAGVTVHRDCGRWSPTDLKRLGRALDAFPAPRRLVVQYAPNVWGYKGLNVGFCRWLVGRRRHGDLVRVMFHEVTYPFLLRDRPSRWLLAVVQRVMARWAVKASTNVDVSIHAWEAVLRRCAPDVRFEVGYRPVPSNIPVIDDAGGVAAVRCRIAPGGETVVGSFSTFSGLTGPPLAAALPRLILAGPGRVALLIGHGSEPMADRLVEVHPDLEGRLRATGELPPADVSRHLQACDLMIQAYPDGVSGRRGSMMAVLSHGVATVTNAGFLSEPLWADSGAVGLAPSCAADDLVRTAERLLADRAERDRVGAAGRDLHERRFAIERTVEALLGLPPARPS
jgi:glycosyltransferase involved in cell wall biosynthesis